VYRENKEDEKIATLCREKKVLRHTFYMFQTTRISVLAFDCETAGLHIRRIRTVKVDVGQPQQAERKA